MSLKYIKIVCQFIKGNSNLLVLYLEGSYSKCYAKETLINCENENYNYTASCGVYANKL